MGAVFEWLLSDAGQRAVTYVAVPVAAYLWRRATRSSRRAAELEELAADLFEFVEVLGAREALAGEEKWKRFVALLLDNLRAAGAPPPTGKELAALRARAQRLAWLAKVERGR